MHVIVYSNWLLFLGRARWCYYVIVGGMCIEESEVISLLNVTALATGSYLSTKMD